MGFYSEIRNLTGTMLIHEKPFLMQGSGFAEGCAPSLLNTKYVNSGVGLRNPLDSGRLDFEACGDGITEFFSKGRRFTVTNLNIPANCLDQGPHCHPSGEFAYIIDGEILMVTCMEML